jgi:NADH:ubiquinone oxidoreductase subunit 5 (subunit L)/multisubunit Na+/H+ antiporter MnhA subunit
MTSSPIDGTYLAIAAPFLAAMLAPFVKRAAGEYAGWLLAVVPALMVLHFSRFLPDIAGNLAHAGGFDWAWQINVRFSYLIDGLSLMFALMITAIGTVVVVHAGANLNGHPRQGRFYSLLFLLMGSTLGLVLADDFLMLFVFWEMTAISGCLLVGFDCERQGARRAAWLALIVPVAGGLPLLAGLLMLIGFLGVPSMSDAIGLGNTFSEHPAYPVVLVLILAGAFAKSAQFPFQFWLPRTAVAPAPAAAYLQSATLAPAGVYLLMRVHPFLGDTPAWSIVLPVTGGLTLVVGAILALRQNDLQGLLAQTTVATLGLIVMLLGTSVPLAILAACAYLLAHALAKSALVLAAGTIADRSGTSDINGLRGMARAMPITCAAIVLAAATLAGAPKTLGFWAMTLAQDALFSPNPLAQILLALLIPSIALITAAAFALAIAPFFRTDSGPAKTARDGSPGNWFGPVILSLGAIGMTVFGAWTGKYLLDPAHLAIALRLGGVGDPTGIRLDALSAISATTWLFGAVICWTRWGRRIRMPRWQPLAEYATGFAGAVFAAGVGAWALARLSSEIMPGVERQSVGPLQDAAVAAMIAAPLFALVRTDFRWLCACLVINALGSVTAGVALGSPIGLAGALAFALQFPIVMAGFILKVRTARRTRGPVRPGNGDQLCGTSPALAALTVVFVFALAGLPPFSGFWSRVILAQAALLEARWWLAAAVLLGGPLILIATARTFAVLSQADRSADKPVGMRISGLDKLTAGHRALALAPSIVLAAMTVFLGVWPALLMSIVDRLVAALLSP